MRQRLSHVVAAIDWNEADVDRLRDALGSATLTVASAGNPDALRALLRSGEVDGAIVERVHPKDRKLLRSLEWLHVLHAGADNLATPELLAEVTVTTSAGRSAEALADHAIFLLLSVVHNSPALMQQQRRRLWSGRPFRGESALFGRTALVIGTGSTGAGVARRLDAMGLFVNGLRRTVASVDQDSPFRTMETWTDRERLRELIAEADVLVLCLPLTDETVGLIGAEELEALGPEGILVNVARGAIVDERALAAACREGTIKGAGIDVATHEPLSVRSPLWRARRVVITPHVTPRQHDREQRSIDAVIDAARAMQAGEQPHSMLPTTAAFSGASSQARLDRRLTGLWLRIAGGRR